jgi:hypothetical protein
LRFTLQKKFHAKVAEAAKVEAGRRFLFQIFRFPVDACFGGDQNFVAFAAIAPFA